MGDQPPLVVDDIGITLVSDMNGGDDVPDEFQVHVGDRHAGRLADMGESDRHIRFGAAAEFDRAEPDLVGDGALKPWILRKILAAGDRIRFEARDGDLLLALAVEISRAR